MNLLPLSSLIILFDSNYQGKNLKDAPFKKIKREFIEWCPPDMFISFDSKLTKRIETIGDTQILHVADPCGVLLIFVQ